MKKLVTCISIVSLWLSLATTALAAETLKVVTLSVPEMTCPVCPITIKKALTKVSGVESIKTDMKTKIATITFDASKTNVKRLISATTEAGYPAVERIQDSPKK